MREKLSTRARSLRLSYDHQRQMSDTPCPSSSVYWYKPTRRRGSRKHTLHLASLRMGVWESYSNKVHIRSGCAHIFIVAVIASRCIVVHWINKETIVGQFCYGKSSLCNVFMQRLSVLLSSTAIPQHGQVM